MDHQPHKIPESSHYDKIFQSSHHEKENLNLAPKPTVQINSESGLGPEAKDLATTRTAFLPSLLQRHLSSVDDDFLPNIGVNQLDPSSKTPVPSPEKPLANHPGPMTPEEHISPLPFDLPDGMFSQSPSRDLPGMPRI